MSAATRASRSHSAGPSSAKTSNRPISSAVTTCCTTPGGLNTRCSSRRPAHPERPECAPASCLCPRHQRYAVAPRRACRHASPGTLPYQVTGPNTGPGQRSGLDTRNRQASPLLLAGHRLSTRPLADAELRGRLVEVVEEVAELGEAFRAELFAQVVSISRTASRITRIAVVPRGVRAMRLERRSSGSARARGSRDVEFAEQVVECLFAHSQPGGQFGGLRSLRSGYWKTFRWAASRSSKPCSCSRSSMRRCTASQGMRRSAPIRRPGAGSLAGFVK